MNEALVDEVRQTCARWRYTRDVELTDADKELFGLCLAQWFVNRVPISLSVLDDLFTYLRDLGLFEGTYELPNRLLTEAELAQIEADSARDAAEQMKKGIR